MEDGIARMGEIVFSHPGLSELRALGLGSCIGLCLFDPVLKIGCMAHIMLPQAKSKDTVDVGKYADTAVPHVVEQMMAKGALKSRMRVAIAGGAQLFALGDSDGSQLDIGRRNIEAVKALLKDANLKLIGEEVGGKSGRTVVFDTRTGKVTVKSVGTQERLLADLAA